MDSILLSLTLKEYMTEIQKAKESGDTTKTNDMENAVLDMCKTMAKLSSTAYVSDDRADANIKTLLPLEEYAAAVLAFGRSETDIAFDMDSMLDFGIILQTDNKIINNERVAIGYSLSNINEIDSYDNYGREYGKYVECFPKTKATVSELIAISRTIESELEKVGITKEMSYDEAETFAKEQWENAERLIAETETAKVKALFESRDFSSLNDDMHGAFLQIFNK